MKMKNVKKKKKKKKDGKGEEIQIRRKIMKEKVEE